MQENKSDGQLLRDYAARTNEDAFREIVSRHADLVYSAALRQVISSHIAEGIAQCVFLDLARKAKTVGEQLTTDASLVGWLYRSTRFAVLTHLRDDCRRVVHERQAMEHLLTNMDPSPDWELIRPILDDAMARLGDKDREALLLRYFKNHDFHAVGIALGVSDDAAQKRVSRAIDRLRELFAKRGVAVGVSGLMAAIASNAVQAAPAELGGSILSIVSSSAVVLNLSALAPIHMTIIQKTFVVTALTLAVGIGIYESHQSSQLQRQLATLQEQQASLYGQLQFLQEALDKATNKLQATLQQNEQLRHDTLDIPSMRNQLSLLKASVNQSANESGEAKQWIARVAKLKDRMERLPKQKIPELQFTTEQDWLDAAKNNLQSDDDYRKAMAKMRKTAENEFAPMLLSVLIEYMNVHEGHFPKEVSELQSYFQPPIDEAILQRYQILPAVNQSTNFGADWIITQKEPVDEDYDYRIGIGSKGWGPAGGFPEHDPNTLMMAIVTEYKAANNGQEPTDPLQIVPFIHTEEEKKAFDRVMRLQAKTLGDK